MKVFSLFIFFSISTCLIGQNTTTSKSFEDQTDLFLSTYVIDGFVDYAGIKASDNNLHTLVQALKGISIANMNVSERKAFYINAYNILVIDQIIKNYPTTSVKEISGFFDRNKFDVGNNSLTLNEIEKDVLLKEYQDSRLHFALICGAVDCPKIWNHAFTAEQLDEQLDARTKHALNDSSFLMETENGFGLSEIFKWNRFEFDGKEGMINFINSFRKSTLVSANNTFYYDYDWSLNDSKIIRNASFGLGNNSFRYVTSAAIPKGGIEVKQFNNLYSQQEGDGQTLNRRSTYLTSSLSYLYGKTNRFNIGFTTRYRRVRNSSLPSSPLDVFKASNDLEGNQKFTAIGPQIRWAPIQRWSNFSIQSSLTFPLAKGLSGGIDGPFLDWAGPVFLTQFFNDKSIGDKFSLFTEIDLLVEEIGGAGKANRISTPITAIFSWFPKKNLTLYSLAGYSPYISSPYDYFRQVGAGVKYQITRNFEVELLYTDFSNKYLNSINGNAATYNIGFRYSR